MINVLGTSRRLLGDLTASAFSRTVRVLLYHSISDDEQDPLAVSPAMFRRHMETVARSGSPIVSGHDLIAMKRGMQDVCITFDDGFEDFKTQALPILNDFGFSSTLFVTSELIGKTEIWPTWSGPRRFLSWEELRELSERDVCIGSHAVHHVHHGSLSREVLIKEFGESREILQKQLDVYLDAIAYPYGNYSALVLDVAREAGYQAGFVAGGLWGNHYQTDRFALRRFSVSANTTPDQIQDVLNGRDDREQVAQGATAQVRRSFAGLVQLFLN